jgi:hypothetical protein
MRRDSTGKWHLTGRSVHNSNPVEWVNPATIPFAMRLTAKKG